MKKDLEKSGQPEIKKITKFEDIDSSVFVNDVKARRAFKAVFGGAKAQSAEITLVSELRTVNPDLKGEDLILEVYKGLDGLVSVEKAKLNRDNEKKALKQRAAR